MEPCAGPNDAWFHFPPRSRTGGPKHGPPLAAGVVAGSGRWRWSGTKALLFLGKGGPADGPRVAPRCSLGYPLDQGMDRIGAAAALAESGWGRRRANAAVRLPHQRIKQKKNKDVNSGTRTFRQKVFKKRKREHMGFKKKREHPDRYPKYP